MSMPISLVRPRRLLLGLSLVAATLLLAACNQPPHTKDTNFSEYNYQYNK